MRKALIVGIDYYENAAPLKGCVNDASKVAEILSRHPVDDSVNFGVQKYLAKCKTSASNNAELGMAIEKLFNGDKNIEVALLYFSGHGCVSQTGGYLCGSDAKECAWGVPLNDIIILANKCPADNKIIILDSCHSGIVGKDIQNGNASQIGEGVTILTASTEKQSAIEENGHGVFTSLFINALDGAAANLMGEITPGSIYAHIDQSLGGWEQRPVFKANVEKFVSLRNVEPRISRRDLHRIAEFFPAGENEYKLDPTYEPDDTVKAGHEDKAIPEHTEIFAILQKYSHEGLVEPIGANHMYHAAMESKKAGLTRLGKHYRFLVLEGRI